MNTEPSPAGHVLDHLADGARIVVPLANGEPVSLLDAVEAGAGQHRGLEVHQMHVLHDELPLFYSDQYDLGMEYVGYADPSTCDVVVRGELPERPFVAFYLDDDGVVRGGMHADEWAATDVIRELVGSPVDADVLADTSVDLEALAEAATS